MTETPFTIISDSTDSFLPGAQPLSERALGDLAQEVITRLTRWSEEEAARSDSARAEFQDIDGLCADLLAANNAGIDRRIAQALASGATHEQVSLHYIAVAARRLGVMWQEDDISFHDVTLAAGRLLLILRDLRAMLEPRPLRRGRVALFASVPDETHVLGITMAADLFRDKGWDIDLRVGVSIDGLISAARSGAYPIIGLSAGSIDRLKGLAQFIVELRLAAPQVLVLVAGNLAHLDPHLALRVGADAAAWSMEDCLSEMERLRAEIAAR